MKNLLKAEKRGLFCNILYLFNPQVKKFIMEDIERLSKDANLAYYEMVNSNKHEPLTKVSGNYKLFTKEKDISTQTLQNFSNEISR